MAGYYGPLIMGTTARYQPGDYVELEKYPCQFARILRESTFDAFMESRTERNIGPLTADDHEKIKAGAWFYEVHTD